MNTFCDVVDGCLGFVSSHQVGEFQADFDEHVALLMYCAFELLKNKLLLVCSERDEEVIVGMNVKIESVHDSNHSPPVGCRWFGEGLCL